MGVKQYAMDGGQNYEDITRFTISQKDDISCGQYMSAKFGQQLVQGLCLPLIRIVSIP